MNYKLIWQVLGRVLIIEAALMLLPLLVSIIYGEKILPFLVTIIATGATGGALYCIRTTNKDMFAREGFCIVGFSWIAMSLFGAIPFVISGDIPNYVDALFETVSGFSTTGASILLNVESLSRGCTFWRMFTQWIGGMGVLVFVMAVLPMSGDHYMHVMRAEVPGPTVGKLVPRVRKTAVILYLIYIALTAILMILLLIGGMDLFDSIIHAFATAGTGGFSSRGSSIAYYNSAYIDVVISIFMLLFGVNFNLFYLMLIGNFKSALKSEEFHVYLFIIFFAVLSIALNIFYMFDSFSQALRASLFQVSSIVTTTGFSTFDFNEWPEYSKWMLVLLMFCGGCAGSTAGGLKVSRIIILMKSCVCEVKRTLKQRSVTRIRLEGKTIDTQTAHYTEIYFIMYLLIILASTFLLSINGFDLLTNFTGTLACISNVGPGLSMVGPAGNFAMFSSFSKIVLILDMLMGRLEIYPIIMLFSATAWRKI